MRKYLSVFCLILACTSTATLQNEKKNPKVVNRPDLTGIWLLDRKVSNVGKSTLPDLPLKITYRDPELTIARLYNHNGQMVKREFVYYTDGRGETNQSEILLITSPKIDVRDLDKQVTRSKTRWRGKKVVTSSIIRNSVGGRMLEFEAIDEWKLSEDGKTLTQTSRTVFLSVPSDALFIPATAPDTKRVYNRVPN